MKIYLAGKVDERKWKLVRPFKYLCEFHASDGAYGTHGPHGWKGGTIIGPRCWETCNDNKAFFAAMVLDRIRESGALIAHLCTADAYGSIAEIAFASAIGKPCYLIVEEHLTDDDTARDHSPLHDAYWFVGTFPGVRVHHAQSTQAAEDCLVQILEEIGVQASSYAYFTEAVGKNEIKIGSSADPWRRLPCLQTGNGSALKLLAIMRGGRDMEGKLHRKFEHLRTRPDGEWYHATDELREFIDNNAKPEAQ